MIYDYSRLRGRIIERFGTLKRFAGAMGISGKHIYMLTNNRVEMRQSTIEKMCALLGIERSEISDYFFTPAVNQR